MFVFVGVLFFRLIANPGLNNSNETTIGNGLAQLQKNRGGRACLFILGFFLIVYGMFAVRLLLCSPLLATAYAIVLAYVELSAVSCITCLHQPQAAQVVKLIKQSEQEHSLVGPLEACLQVRFLALLACVRLVDSADLVSRAVTLHSC